MKRNEECDSTESPSRVSGYEVFSNLLEGCQVVSPDWRYLYLNDAVARHARRPKHDLLGRTMMEAFPGIDGTPMFALLRQTMEDRRYRTLENEFTFPDGSKGWFELRFEPVPEGVLILSLEMTERKNAERRVAHLNSVLRGLRRVNQLITRESDPSRLVQGACEVLVESRGYDAAVIALTDETGRKILSHAEAGRKLLPLRNTLERGEVPDCAEQAMAGHGLVRRSLQEQPCSGCPILKMRDAESDDLSLVLEQDGRIYGFMIVAVPGSGGDEPEEQGLLREVVQDLSFALHGIEVRRERDKSRESLDSTEKQLWQAQKLEAVGRLAGGVAHDFNNILAAQIGYCDLLKLSLGGNERALRDLGEIEACADRAAALTGQLLAFSRKQTLQPRVLDLNAVVIDFGKMLRRLIGEDVELVTVLAGNVGRVMVDAGQMEQVILNLAVNARDAMPHGGKLVIETANVELDQDFLNDHPEATAGPHVMLGVSDTGCGLDDVAKARLFEPFFTTKEKGKGTGLGLSTVYGIVKQSGGSIWVYSEPGQGTTFKIFLPRIDAEVTTTVTRTASSRRGQGELVLVVEDDERLRALFERMVEGLGYQVRVAATGADALRRVEEEGLRPDLLVTDVVMPGMSGKDLAENLSHVKALFMSGYTDNTIGDHGILDSEAHFIQKPFSLEELAAKMREALG